MTAQSAKRLYSITGIDHLGRRDLEKAFSRRVEDRRLGRTLIDRTIERVYLDHSPVYHCLLHVCLVLDDNRVVVIQGDNIGFRVETVTG